MGLIMYDSVEPMLSAPEDWEPCDLECAGYAVFNGNELQRCDACGRFATDADALAHVTKLAHALGMSPDQFIAKLAVIQIRE